MKDIEWASNLRKKLLIEVMGTMFETPIFYEQKIIIPEYVVCKWKLEEDDIIDNLAYLKFLLKTPKHYTNMPDRKSIYQVVRNKNGKLVLKRVEN